MSKAEAGALYQTFVDAQALRLKALAAGESREVADAIVANALKAAWPKGREEAWRYVCEACDDTGYQYHACPGDATCNLTKVHAPHNYVTLCWCAKGRAMTPKPRGSDDDLQAIGKVAKPTRFGR